MLGSTLTSCYTWKRSFVFESKCQSKKHNRNFDVEKVIPLDAQDFFYMKQVEYFEPYENKSDGPEPYTNEASVRLYKSVPVSYNVPKGEKVVEEKYMYVLNYSNPDAESGEVFYFRTATYWGEGKDRGADDHSKTRLKPSILRQHFENKDIIDLSTSLEIQMGFWYRDSKDSIRFLLNNGSDKYQVIATGYKDSIVFEQISHPNKDLTSRSSRVEQFVQLSEVMNVQNSRGLVYYRNMLRDSTEEREIVVTLDTTTYRPDILKMRYNSEDKNDLMEAKCYLVSDKATLVQRKKHKTIMISEANRSTFENKMVVPSRKDVKEERKRLATDGKD